MFVKIATVNECFATFIANEISFCSRIILFRALFNIIRIVKHFVNVEALKVRANFIAKFTSHRLLVQLAIRSFLAQSTMLLVILFGGDHRQLAHRAELTRELWQFVKVCDVNVESVHRYEKFSATFKRTNNLLHLTIVILQQFSSRKFL